MPTQPQPANALVGGRTASSDRTATDESGDDAVPPGEDGRRGIGEGSGDDATQEHDVVGGTGWPGEHAAAPSPEELEAMLEADPVPTWEEVASRYGQKIYSMAYRLTGDPDDAKDLAQDVFVRVYRNLDKYRPGTFDGWLYRITKNLFLDKVRRKRRIRMEALPDEDWNQPVETDPSPEDRVELGLLRGDIEQALTTLPPTFRTAVVLCDIQDLSYEEIADATGWPLGTVRSRIHRGRRLLRQALADTEWDVRSDRRPGADDDA